MRARAFGLGIIAGLLLAVVPVVFSSQFRWVYPTPDTESVFLKSYNPRALVPRFACGQIVPMWQGLGPGGSAGIGFVSHQGGIIADLEIDEDHWLPLMKALAADVNKQLLLGGSSRFGEGKDITSRFYYQDGRSLGTVTIPPLLPYDWVTAQTNSRYPSHPGCTPVVLSIYVDEVFVPKLPIDLTDQLARITNRLDRNRHDSQSD
jgi:hypothetical protein